MNVLYILLCIAVILAIIVLLEFAGAIEIFSKTYIVSTATIMHCDDKNQTCKILASDSVKKELKGEFKDKNPYENLFENLERT